MGKTELAKTLAEFLFDDEDALHPTRHVGVHGEALGARLVGSPPGYVGYDEGGQLTEAVRRKPFSVVLFDEVEKAHPDVFNILLQILEDGRLTDSQGRAVDFKNTILIMTSQPGNGRPAQGGYRLRQGLGLHHPRAMKEKVNQALKEHFSPEFLNRIDDTIVFHELHATGSHADRRPVHLASARAAKRSRASVWSCPPRPRGTWPTRATTPNWVRDRCVERFSSTSRTHSSEKILYKEFHAGQTIVVDAVRATRARRSLSKASRDCRPRSTSRTPPRCKVTATL